MLARLEQLASDGTAACILGRCPLTKVNAVCLSVGHG
jgi:hypothetical protein